MHSPFWQNVLIGWSQRLNSWNQSDPNKFSVFFSTKTFNFLVIPFSVTGIIISPSNFISFPVTVRGILLVIFISGLFNFLQVCKFIIDRLEPESNWNLTDLLSTLTVMYLRTTLSDLSSLFVCLTLFFIIFLFLHCEPYVRIYGSFDIFWTIGTVLGPMYFSTAVASAGCFFFFFFFVTSLPVLKFWVIIFFLFYRRSWLSLRKKHQTPRYFLSLFWHSLSSDRLQPVFEVWDRVRSLISTKLCVWFLRLLQTLGLVRISDIWSYPLTILLV